MTVGRVVILCLGVLAILRLSCSPLGSGGKSVPKYRTARVERGDIRSTVSATGTLNAVTTVQVGSQLSGIVYKLYADFNSQVKQGQLLAEIDPATFQATVDQSRADVEVATAAVRTATTDLLSLSASVSAAAADVSSSKANVRRAEVQAADRELTWKRTRELASKKFAAQQDHDTALANLNMALAEVAAAKAAVEVSEAKYKTACAQRVTGDSKLDAAKAQLEQRKASRAMAEVNLARTKILSPIDGVVVSRNVDTGQTVAASFQAPVLFVIANDLRLMQIDANVDEADIGRVQMGQRVEFTVDAYPDERFRGKVVQIRLQPIVSQNVVTYDTVVQVANDELLLRPGMTANIYVQVARATDALKVHNAALSYVPPASLMGNTVGFKGSRGDSSSRPASRGSTGGEGRRGSRGDGRERGDRERGGREGRKRDPEGTKDQRPQGGGSVETKKIMRKVYKVGVQAPDPVDVQVGISDGSFTEVLSGAVSEGDEVIIGSESQESGSTQGPTNPFAPRRR